MLMLILLVIFDTAIALYAGRNSMDKSWREANTSTLIFWGLLVFAVHVLAYALRGAL